MTMKIRKSSTTMKIRKSSNPIEGDETEAILKKMGWDTTKMEDAELEKIGQVLGAVWAAARTDLLEELRDSQDAADYEPAIDFITGNGFAKF